MIVRSLAWIGLAVVAGLAVGCSEEEFRPGSPSPATGPATSASPQPGDSPSQAGSPASSSNSMDDERRVTLLRSVIQLIEDSAVAPDAKNFSTATDYLNEYFNGTPAAEYALSEEGRKFLAASFPEEALRDFGDRRFDPRRDPMHIKDCLLYQAVAGHVAGQGDDLERVRRVFHWVSRQIMLVPPEYLSVPGVIYQAQARPYDVLVRGIATEGDGTWTDKNEPGYWAERGWLFLSLCRQLGVDAGLVTIQPKAVEGQPAGRRRFWLCAALIDGKAYLFDARLGVEVPGPGGQGVATLDQVLADPSLVGPIAQTEETGDGPRYGVQPDDLRGSKIGIAIDSSTGYFRPKMRLLQKELAARNRMVLFRDPAEQRDAFARALGDSVAEIGYWMLPLEVEVRLFTDSRFVESSKLPLAIHDPMYPLLRARLFQLRGDLTQAIQSYVAFLHNPEEIVKYARDHPINPRDPEAVSRRNQAMTSTDLHSALDLNATYFLGLCQLEKGNLTQSENLLRQVVKLVPDESLKPGPPFFQFFRYGAVANLGRIEEDRGKIAEALELYRRDLPAPLSLGNAYRARLLEARAPKPDTTPPAEPEKPADPPGAQAGDPGVEAR